jgi:PAS domain S-box-containing protein/diguanylate cyclase (GGDEF)-like protein
MERLKKLVLASEDEIVRRMFERACAQGYGQRMPALEESYRIEVGSLSANLVQAIELEGDILPLAAGGDLAQDPVAALGARLARARDAAHAEATLLLGLLKCYRSTYLDVASAGLPEADVDLALRTIGRFFDRVEIGVVFERVGGDAGRAPSPADRRGSLVEERNRYLAAFSSLPLPALFIDQNGRVEHINAAASLLFGPPSATSSRYFPEPAGRDQAPVLAREIEEFRDQGDVEKSFERELKTAKGTRYFQVRFTKTPTADGTFTGMLVVLNDLTYRRNAEEALRRSQNEYAALFENMPIGFVHTRVLLDRRNRVVDHTVLEVNAAFERLSGVSASSLVGHPFTEVLRSCGAEGPEWMAALGRTALTGETASFEAMLGSQGVWAAVTAFSPSPGHVALMVLDITDVKAIEQSLARSRDSYLTLLEGLPSLVWRAGRDGRIDFVNEAWAAFTGLPSVLPETVWTEAVHPDDAERRRTALAAAAAERGPLEIEYRLRDADGTYRWVQESGRPFEGLDGSFAGLIGTTIDVSDRRHHETDSDIASRDLVTGLPSDVALEALLARAATKTRRGEPTVLLVALVDGFKALEASRGDGSADAARRRVAEVITGLVRAGDVVARSGPDEFAVLLRSAGLDVGEAAGLRLLEAVRGIDAFGPRLLVASAGLTRVSGTVDALAAVREARDAARASREAGGDRIAVVDAPGGPLRITGGRGAACEVDAALRSGEGLTLLYQPAFVMADGSVPFCEALLRLHGENGVLLEPAAFLSDAVAAGLTPGLDRWVVEHAIAELQRSKCPAVSVNLSAAAISDIGLLADAAILARDAGVLASSVIFEVSEEDALADMERALAFVAAARGHGFGVALDHVGRSTQSFAHLRELRPDRVTIDGGVVSSLLGDPRQVRLVESVQSVASALGIATVAQWVEDRRTLEIAAGAGVDMAQGRYLAAPATATVTASAAPWGSALPAKGAIRS